MSLERPRLVVDTSVVVSAILKSDSVPAEALRLAYKVGTVLVSDATIEELQSVITRPSLARYVDAVAATNVIRAYCATADWVAVVSSIHACRDPNDDKFLALALSGQANAIITGDDDLLVLHPFEGIDIVSPRDFLNAWATR